MVIFYIGAAIGAVLAVVYLALGTLSFLRIRRELLTGSDFAHLDGNEQETAESSDVSVVPGFSWKAALAVATSFVVLVIASFSGAFWYVLALSGFGTAAAVIVAFVVELRNDRIRTLVP